MSPRTSLLALALPLLVAAGATASDEILERVDVPSAEKPQGEVRIVRRDGQVVVQTLLNSKVLRRVAGEIAKKEARNWPTGQPGSEDAALYVEALRRVVNRIRATPPEGDRRDRRRTLGIEFFTNDQGGRVVLTGAGVGEQLDLSREYVALNMRLIVADAFAISAEQAGTWLERADGRSP